MTKTLETEYVIVNRASRVSSVAHLPHPTRGDSTLCGWIGILPWGWEKAPPTVCQACKSATVRIDEANTYYDRTSRHA